jgi:hypothetical protein
MTGMKVRAIKRIRIGDGRFLVNLHQLSQVELVFAGQSIHGRLSREFDMHFLLFNRVSHVKFTERCDFLMNIEVKRK